MTPISSSSCSIGTLSVLLATPRRSATDRLPCTLVILLYPRPAPAASSVSPGSSKYLDWDGGFPHVVRHTQAAHCASPRRASRRPRADKDCRTWPRKGAPHSPRLPRRQVSNLPVKN